MRILLDQAEHTLRNKGNNAMLQATVQRLTSVWPEAAFDLITIAPNLARVYYPAVAPVDPYTLRPYQGRMDVLHRYLPGAAWQLGFELREELWQRRPRKTAGATAELSRLEDVELLDELDFSEDDGQQISSEVSGLSSDLIEAIAQYDLYIATGGGYVCDHDKELLLALFDRLDAAISSGVPTVLAGQGVGPMQDPLLLARAREVLPRTYLLFYRNERLGRPLLEEVGVPADKMMMTGDDAVEMAHQSRRATLGNGIGISLRVSSYTGVNAGQIDRLRNVLHQAAAEREAQLISVPISSAAHESDVKYIKQLIKGYPDTTVSWKR